MMGVAYSEPQTNYFSKQADIYIVTVYHMQCKIPEF